MLGFGERWDGETYTRQTQEDSSSWGYFNNKAVERDVSIEEEVGHFREQSNEVKRRWT